MLKRILAALGGTASATAITRPAFAAEPLPPGVIGGGHIGYDVQINQWVLGVEGSGDGTNMSTTQHVVAIPALFEADLRTRSDIQGSICGRLGIAFDRVLLYGTGGVAFAGV